MQPTDKKFVALAGEAPQSSVECGAIVFWNSANAVQRPALVQAWGLAGLPSGLLPPDKSPEVALREAVDSVCSTRRFRRKAPNGGWIVVNEAVVQGATLAWDEGARCTLDKVGRLAVAFPQGVDPTLPANALLEQELRAAYDGCLNSLDGATVTGWLVGLVRSQNAIGLKDTGGVYFVPHATLGQWRVMSDVVGAVTGTPIHEIATVLIDEHASRIVSAIIASLEREAEAEASAMFRELSDPNSALGKRALETRARKCNDLRTKVQSYGAMLGTSMDTLMGRLESLSAAVAAASMAASTEAA